MCFKNNIYLAAILLLLTGAYIPSQSITWNRMYDVPNHLNNDANAICEVTPGIFYVAGNSGDSLHLMKINSFGDTIWTRFYDYSVPEEIISSGDGGCIIAGWGYVAKISTSGDSIWLTPLPSVRLYSIARTNDNNLIACGEIDIFKGCIAKINPNGIIQWQRTYISAYTRIYTSITLGNDGGYIAAGRSDESSSVPSSTLITKINDSGEVVWEKKHSIVNNRYSVILSIENFVNGYIIGGVTDNSLSPTYDNPFFGKLDNSGDLTFSKVFTTDSTEYMTAFDKRNDNRFIYATYDIPKQLNDSVLNRLVVIDSQGVVVAQKKISSPDFVEFESLISLSNGDIIFAGSADFIRIGNNQQDAYLIRTDSLLNYPQNIFGIEPIGNTIPQYFKLYQNYPNPFNPRYNN